MGKIEDLPNDEDGIAMKLYAIAQMEDHIKRIKHSMRKKRSPK